MVVRHLLEEKRIGFDARLGVEGKEERGIKDGTPVIDLHN